LLVRKVIDAKTLGTLAAVGEPFDNPVTGR
jgi:hypothetical protein